MCTTEHGSGGQEELASSPVLTSQPDCLTWGTSLGSPRLRCLAISSVQTGLGLTICQGCVHTCPAWAQVSLPGPWR